MNKLCVVCGLPIKTKAFPSTDCQVCESLVRCGYMIKGEFKLNPSMTDRLQRILNDQT